MKKGDLTVETIYNRNIVKQEDAVLLKYTTDENKSIQSVYFLLLWEKNKP